MNEVDLDKIDANHLLEIIVDEPEEIEEFEAKLRKAILGFKNFYQVPTPLYIREPVYDQTTNMLLKAGIEQNTLYQFDLKNQEKINDIILTLHQGIASVPDVVSHLRSELWRNEHGMSTAIPLSTYGQALSPPPQVMQQLPPPQSEGRFSRLFGRKPEVQQAKDSPYYKLDPVIAFLELVPEKWALICEYHNLGINDGNINWSTESTRAGMEDYRKIVQSVFSFWIEPRLMTIFKLSYRFSKERTVNNSLKVLTAQATVAEKHRNDMMAKINAMNVNS